MDCPARYVSVLSYCEGVLVAGRGAVRPASWNLLSVPHFEQLTREICPRLVTDVTMCPRSSSHTAQILSVRSPTVNRCFSIGFSLSRSFVPLGVSVRIKNKASGLYLTRRLCLKRRVAGIYPRQNLVAGATAVITASAKTATTTAAIFASLGFVDV